MRHGRISATLSRATTDDDLSQLSTAFGFIGEEDQLVLQVAEPEVRGTEDAANPRCAVCRWILLGVILLVAAALRLWGVTFGLPYEYHVDEVQYVRQAASMGAKGLAPTWWNNPPFFKYLLFAEDGGLFLFSRLAGWYKSSAAFGSTLSIDPTVLYVMGRATSALFGVFTVLVAYVLTRDAFNRRAGLVAAWILATCFIHVRDSHFATNDIAVTFFMTFAVWCAVRLLKCGKIRWYALGGAAVRLGFATKYSAAFVALPLLTGLTRWNGDGWDRN